jgi:hypothetical protein
LVFLDALRISIRDEGTVRDTSVYLVLGGVRPDSIRETPGPLDRMLIAIVDGPEVFP